MRGTVAYAAVSIVGIGVFAATRRYTWFAISQFVPYMILPFLLMWALGGPVNGSGVGLWAGLGPIVALLLGHLWQATLLVVLYVGLLVVTVLAPASVPAMSAPSRDLFFILNLAGVPIVTWLLVRVFAGGREGALASVRSVVRRYLPADLVTALEADPHRLDLGGQIAEVTLFSLGVNSTNSSRIVALVGGVALATAVLASPAIAARSQRVSDTESILFCNNLSAEAGVAFAFAAESQSFGSFADLAFWAAPSSPETSEPT